MYPFAHVTFTLLLTKRFWERGNLSPYLLAAGALLPDVVDKSLLLAQVGGGRFIGHTLTFALLAFLLAGIKSYPWGVSLSGGVLFHLLGDLNAPLPWLYPFVRYSFGSREEFDLLEAYFSLSGIGMDAIALLSLAMVWYGPKLSALRGEG